KRRDLKVIVTSATIDTERFAAHFGGAPVVDVEGRGHPVEVRYGPLEGEERKGGRKGGQSHFSPGDEREAKIGGKKSDPDPLSALSVLDGILAACDEIARERPMGDTLIFLP